MLKLTLLIPVISSQSCYTETANSNCTSCIQTAPKCGWMMKITQDKNKVGCIDTSSLTVEERNLIESDNTLIFPKTQVQTLNINKGNTYLNNQDYKVTIRPGDKTNLDITFKNSELWPVDLYFLVDSSASMQFARENLRKSLDQILRKFERNDEGKKIDLSIGLGFYSDKHTTPFTLIKGDDYLFKNHYSLEPFTSNSITKFGLAISKLDQNGQSPMTIQKKGTLEAIVQVATCDRKVRWNKAAKRFVIVLTDGMLQMSGDGRLAGLAIPHPNQCLLKSSNYYQGLDYDYPSVHQVKSVLDLTNIQVYFGIPQDGPENNSALLTYYKDAVKVLGDRNQASTFTSSNLAEKIYQAYQESMKYVELTVSRVSVKNDQSVSDSDFDVSFTVKKCPSKIGKKCVRNSIRKNSPLVFDLEISLKTGCSKDKIEVMSPGFGGQEKVVIDLVPVCQCNCGQSFQHLLYKGKYCSGNGIPMCGKCMCFPGYVGEFCSCLEADQKKLVNQCIEKGSIIECSGKGRCLCGKCQCDMNREGDFCECGNRQCENFSKILKLTFQKN